MLALTPTAVEVVRTITSTPEAPDGAGLRIATASDGPREGALELSVTTGPADDDQVVAGPGTQIYLDQRAAAYLEDKVLDANLDEEGTATFFVGEPGQDSTRG
jgi:iron-sulfur cluster assembly protein